MSVCPDRDILEAYLLGATPHAQLEEVASHVRACSPCLIKLDDLNGRTSPLIASMRRGHLCPVDERVEQAVRRVKQTVQMGSPPVAAVPGELHEYRLLEQLGEGGMGQVYRAVHARLGKTVAVKILTASRLHEQQAVARFEREMKAVGALSHPNVVAAFDAGEVEGRHYLVMEYVPGVDLARLVKEGGPLPVAAACEVARQAAEGLAYAHAQGMVHRDVKPSNLILTPEGQVKVLDLGLALLKDELPNEPLTESPVGSTSEGPSTLTGTRMLTSVSCVVGTNDYMAPEQWRDSHSVGAQADQYSLGCTLFYLLTGRPLFDTPEHPTLYAKCEAHRLHAPPSLRALRPDVPARLEKVVLRMLTKAPEERYPDARAVAKALRPFTSKSDLVSLLRRSGEGETPVAPRKGRRSRLAILLSVGLGLVGLSVAPFLVRSPEKGEVAAPPTGSIPMPEEEARDLQRRWADHLGQEVGVRNSLGMDLVLIPPGEFGMTPDLKVRITQPFRILTTEVTVGQYRAFVAATNHRTEAEASGKGGHLYDPVRGHRPLVRDPSYVWSAPGHATVGDDHPVTQVAWVDAEAFCRWLSDRDGKRYRLPTEAEWKWACRAGSTAHFVLGHTLEDLYRHAWVAENTRGQPMPVARRVPNAWGLFDMLGNVQEWVLDWFAELPQGDVTNPAGPPNGSSKVRVSSCYGSVTQAWHGRGKAGPGAPAGFVGFRVLCEVSPDEGPRPLDHIRPPERPKEKERVPAR